MATGSWVNIGGTWRKVRAIYVNINGNWRKVKGTFLNIGGVWRKSWTPGGNVYLHVGSSLVKLNPDGGFIWSYALTGSAYYSSPVVVDPDGHVYFSYTASEGVETLKINQNGGRVWTALYPYNVFRPDAITVNRNGEVFVGYDEWFRVIKYNSSGSQVWVMSSTRDYEVIDIQSDSDGFYYTVINDWNKSTAYIQKRNPSTSNLSGGVIWEHTFDDFKVQRGAIDHNKNAYVVSIFSSVYKLNPNGSRVWKVDVESLTGITTLSEDIDVDKDGNVYVARMHNPYTTNIGIHKLNSNGSLVLSMLIGTGSNTVRVEPSGNVFAAKGISRDSVSYYYPVKLTSQGAIMWEYSSVARSLAVDPGRLGAFPDKW